MKIRTPIALIKPRSLNPLATAGASSGPGVRTASKHVIAACPPSVSAVQRAVAEPAKPSLLSARGQLHPCKPPAVLTLSDKLFSCLCFHGYLQKGREHFVLWLRRKSRSLSLSARSLCNKFPWVGLRRVPGGLMSVKCGRVRGSRLGWT